MINQAFVKTTLFCNIFSLPLYIPMGPIEFSPQDLGYEINEDDLASEMLAQLPDDLLGQTTPEVDPEEFESIYKWFLS